MGNLHHAHPRGASVASFEGKPAADAVAKEVLSVCPRSTGGAHLCGPSAKIDPCEDRELDDQEVAGARYEVHSKNRARRIGRWSLMDLNSPHVHKGIRDS